MIRLGFYSRAFAHVSLRRAFLTLHRSYVYGYGIQIGPSTKGGGNVLTLYARRVAGWILHFVQDDMDVASWYATYYCVLCCVLTS